MFVGDCRWLPFKNGSKDFIIVQGGLHHLGILPQDLELTLAEISRTLRDDGVLAVVEPWLTPFLAFVHRACRFKIARRMVPKLDALAVMIDNERKTYEQWLNQPEAIVQLFKQYFSTELYSAQWGKCLYVGRKRARSG